jgi:RimJ/RimL family protein N-acetyltransferase
MADERMATVETARLLLRPWSESDTDELARLYADPEVMRYMSTRPLTQEESAGVSAGMLRQWQEHGFGPWAVIEKAGGCWIGRIGLDALREWPDPHNIEVGWELHRAWWGQGLATEGALAALRFGFEVCGLERIISATVPDNLASRRVMEKAGLRYQGIRRYGNTDVVWYAIDRATWVRQAG